MKLTPLLGESAADYLARQAVADCTPLYLAATINLAKNVTDARADGISPVFDGDAAHAMAVMDAAEAAPLTDEHPVARSRSQQIGDDILARVLLARYKGADPGSPADGKGMAIVPSDPAAFVAAMTQLGAALAGIDGLSYSVVDVPPVQP